MRDEVRLKIHSISDPETAEFVSGLSVAYAKIIANKADFCAGLRLRIGNNYNLNMGVTLYDLEICIKAHRKQ